MGARYQMPKGAALRVFSASGKIIVTAEDRSDFEIDPPDRRVGISDDGRTLEVRTMSGSLEIRCPRGTDVSVGGVSGHVGLAGRFGSVKVSTVSGHIDVGEASGDVDARSISGHLSVLACGGRCQLNTKSGHISIGRADKGARASTISGKIELATTGQGDVSAKTISGHVTIKVAGDKRPHARLRSLSGRVRCDCPQGSDFELEASTVSGHIEVAGR